MVGHVVQGTKILLQCTVRAARPAANITWQNGTEYLNASDRFDMFETKVEENVSISEKILILLLTFNETCGFIFEKESNTIIEIAICKKYYICIQLQK